VWSIEALCPANLFSEATFAAVLPVSRPHRSHVRIALSPRVLFFREKFFLNNMY
jgi:hypothetical protein